MKKENINTGNDKFKYRVGYISSLPKEGYRMEFITVEQFKEQPKEVREVFLDWWQPSIGDIFIFTTDEFDNSDSNIGVLASDKQIKITNTSKGKYRIPLFTEGQLRKFISDKLICERQIERLGDNILQAYWKAACMVAKEELDG